MLTADAKLSTLLLYYLASLHFLSIPNVFPVPHFDAVYYSKVANSMPTPGEKIHVQLSLAECLEVRAGPLDEDELWALICEGAVSIQDLFLNGKTKNENMDAH